MDRPGGTVVGKLQARPAPGRPLNVGPLYPPMRMLKITALLTSHLLCVAVLALWTRSMSTSDFWLYAGETSDHRGSVREGRIVWERTTPSQVASGFSHGAGPLDDVSASIAEDWLRAVFGNREPATFDYARRVTPGNLFIAPV